MLNGGFIAIYPRTPVPLASLFDSSPDYWQRTDASAALAARASLLWNALANVLSPRWRGWTNAPGSPVGAHDFSVFGSVEKQRQQRRAVNVSQGNPARYAVTAALAISPQPKRQQSKVHQRELGAWLALP